MLSCHLIWLWIMLCIFDQELDWPWSVTLSGEVQLSSSCTWFPVVFRCGFSCCGCDHLLHCTDCCVHVLPGKTWMWGPTPKGCETFHGWNKYEQTKAGFLFNIFWQKNPFCVVYCRRITHTSRAFIRLKSFKKPFLKLYIFTFTSTNYWPFYFLSVWAHCHAHWHDIFTNSWLEILKRVTAVVCIFHLFYQVFLFKCHPSSFDMLEWN